jgi:hypothetical protein
LSSTAVIWSRVAAAGGADVPAAGGAVAAQVGRRECRDRVHGLQRVAEQVRDRLDGRAERGEAGGEAAGHRREVARQRVLERADAVQQVIADVDLRERQLVQRRAEAPDLVGRVRRERLQRGADPSEIAELRLEQAAEAAVGEPLGELVEDGRHQCPFQ